MLTSNLNKRGALPMRGVKEVYTRLIMKCNIKSRRKGEE
jgi:hypothetical protein